MVIDDDELILIAISEKLKSKGHAVWTAINGRKALDVLNTEKINLIVCDVIMPGVSALSLLGMLRKHGIHNIPLILISSLSSANIISESLGLKIFDFLTKPIDYDYLNSRISELEKRKEGNVPEE